MKDDIIFKDGQNESQSQTLQVNSENMPKDDETNKKPVKEEKETKIQEQNQSQKSDKNEAPKKEG